MAYHFPVLKPKDIHLSLRDAFASSDMTFSPSLTNIENPTATSFCRLLSEIFELVFGCRMQLQMPFTSENVEHDELYQDAFQRVLFLKNVQKIGLAAGIKDISFKDLKNPSKGRVLRILSGIVNFLKFQLQYEEAAEKTSENLENEEKARDESSQKLRKSVHELEALKQKKRKNEQQHAVVVQQNEFLETEVASLNERKSQVTALREKGKNELQGHLDEEAQLKVLLAGLKQEIGSLEAKVVHSPERVKNEIEQLKTKIHELCKEKPANEKAIAAKQTSVDFMEETSSQVIAKCQTLIEQIKEREAERKVEQRQLGDDEEREAALELEYKKSISEEQNAQRTVERLRQTKGKKATHLETAGMAARQEKDEFSMEKDAILSDKRAKQKQLDGLKMKRALLEKQFNEKEERRESSVKHAQKRYEDVLDEVIAAVENQMELLKSATAEIESQL